MERPIISRLFNRRLARGLPHYLSGSYELKDVINHVQGTNKGNSRLLSGLDEQFHVYSAVWTPEQIDVSVDGERYFTFAKEPGGDAVWPFDKPQYLILNLAIGGSWGGQKGIDDSALPTRFVIDYVRIYRL